MALNDRKETNLTGGEPLLVTTGERTNIGNALPLTVAANRLLQAADRNEITGINTSTLANSSNKFIEGENPTSQELNPINIFAGPKKNRVNLDKRPIRTSAWDTK